MILEPNCGSAMAEDVLTPLFFLTFNKLPWLSSSKCHVIRLRCFFPQCYCMIASITYLTLSEGVEFQALSHRLVEISIKDLTRLSGHFGLDPEPNSIY